MRSPGRHLRGGVRVRSHDESHLTRLRLVPRAFHRMLLAPARTRCVVLRCEGQELRFFVRIMIRNIRTGATARTVVGALGRAVYLHEGRKITGKACASVRSSGAASGKGAKAGGRPSRGAQAKPARLILRSSHLQRDPPHWRLLVRAMCIQGTVLTRTRRPRWVRRHVRRRRPAKMNDKTMH